MAEDLALLGAPPEILAQIEQASQQEDFPVMPENWETVQAFLRVQTQWRFASSGVPLGLDYTAVDVALRRLGVRDDDGAIFRGLQVMEWAALGAVKD